MAKNSIQGQNEEADKQKTRKRNVLEHKSIAQYTSIQIKTVKFYAPLNIYLDLHMDLPELYSRLRPYILRTEDLQKNGFPLFAPDQSGKVIIHTNFKIESSDPDQRWCSRCGEKYYVFEDGTYQADTICNYHSGKRHGAGPFSCCGHYTSKGCMTNKHHVSSYNTVLKNVKFMKTRQKHQLQVQNTIYALDCEMCYTVQGLEVARVSMVGTDGLTVYDSYVLPENPVIDYNTDYSGITANHLRDVKTTLADVQAVLLKHLNSRTILVGHALDNDLKALHIVHETVVDTSVVYPHHFGPPYKRSLKSLAASILNHKIQVNDGHDSVEDARTCMELLLYKIQTDKRVCTQPNQFVPSSPPPLPIPQQQWAFGPLPINTVTVIPYNVGYWVPPVGSSSDLY